MAELLIQKGADLEQGECVADITPLTVSVSLNHPEVCKVLLKHGANPNGLTKVKKSALYLAAQEGYVGIAEQLIQKGADLEQKEVNHGLNALLVGVSMIRVPVVELLLRHGANVNCVANNGHTPLSLALGLGHKGMAELIMKYQLVTKAFIILD